MLVPIVRVLAFVLFPGSVISVQTAYVSRKMEFKGLFKRSHDLRGCGVWRSQHLNSLHGIWHLGHRGAALLLRGFDGLPVLDRDLEAGARLLVYPDCENPVLWLEAVGGILIDKGCLTTCTALLWGKFTMKSCWESITAETSFPN